MKQKLEDLMLLLKRDRRAQTALVLVAMGLLYVMVADNSPRRPPVAQVRELPRTELRPDQAYTDLLQTITTDMSKLRETTEQQGARIEEMRRDFDDNVNRTAEILKKMLTQMADLQAGTSVQHASITGPVDIPGEALGDLPQDTDELQPFGLETAEVAPPPPPPPGRKVIIGPGDSVRLKLLAGVNAPTDGTPYPVVFKLVSDVYGPDSSALPLGEARVVAAAQGSLTDQRALFRLTSLNLRMPNGRRKIIDVDGWVVGEDGIRGMQGVLIDPLGKAVAGAGIAAGVQGIGQGMSQSQLEQFRSADGTTSQFISGNTGQFALGLGVSSAANEWSSIIRERLDQMVPVVQVLSGREATAVFARPVVIEDLYEALEDDYGAGDPFASLD